MLVCFHHMSRARATNLPFSCAVQGQAALVGKNDFPLNQRSANDLYVVRNPCFGLNIRVGQQYSQIPHLLHKFPKYPHRPRRREPRRGRTPNITKGVAARIRHPLMSRKLCKKLRPTFETSGVRALYVYQSICVLPNTTKLKSGTVIC